MNTVTVEPYKNMVVVAEYKNTVTIEVIRIHTDNYFFSSHQVIPQHKEVT